MCRASTATRQGRCPVAMPWLHARSPARPDPESRGDWIGFLRHAVHAMTPDAEHTHAACLQALLQAHEGAGVLDLHAQRCREAAVGALRSLDLAPLACEDHRAAPAGRACKS